MIDEDNYYFDLATKMMNNIHAIKEKENIWHVPTYSSFFRRMSRWWWRSGEKLDTKHYFGGKT